jgi:AraC-like DNA-binding protein
MTPGRQTREWQNCRYAIGFCHAPPARCRRSRTSLGRPVRSRRSRSGIWLSPARPGRDAVLDDFVRAQTWAGQDIDRVLDCGRARTGGAAPRRHDHRPGNRRSRSADSRCHHARARGRAQAGRPCGFDLHRSFCSRCRRPPRWEESDNALDGRSGAVGQIPKRDRRSRVLYIDEESVLTSAGIAAGIDLCLHIVRKDFGAELANEIARRLVVAPHRSGGQAQFVLQPVAEPRGQRLEGTRTWVLDRLAEPLTVARMAKHAGRSLRTFARHFHEETGTSPLQWLLRHRILAAQQLLEQTDLAVDRVAGDAGFGSSVSLRVHFRRELNTTPLAYRRAFRQTGAF